MLSLFLPGVIEEIGSDSILNIYSFMICCERSSFILDALLLTRSHSALSAYQLRCPWVLLHSPREWRQNGSGALGFLNKISWILWIPYSCYSSVSLIMQSLYFPLWCSFLVIFSPGLKICSLSFISITAWTELGFIYLLACIFGLIIYTWDSLFIILSDSVFYPLKPSLFSFSYCMTLEGFSLLSLYLFRLPHFDSQTQTTLFPTQILWRNLRKKEN